MTSDALSDKPDDAIALDATLGCAAPDAIPSLGIRGTPAYMSRQQAQGPPSIQIDDIFAFGHPPYEWLNARQSLPVRRMLLELSVVWYVEW